MRMTIHRLPGPPPRWLDPVRHPVMVTGLLGLVPLAATRMAGMTWSQRDTYVTSVWGPHRHNLDELMFTTRPGGLAALAAVLAHLAHQPGGVDALGWHWCVDHQPCLDADTRLAAAR